MAGENMIATEWIWITSENEVMRCTPKMPNPDGIVAYSGCENSYTKGDRVPIYLIMKENIKQQITCPKCGGKGWIYENI